MVFVSQFFGMLSRPLLTQEEEVSGVVWDLSNVSYVSNTWVGSTSTTTNGISVSDDFTTMMLSEFNAFNETTGATAAGDFDGTETTTQTLSWLNTNNGSVTDLYSNNGTDLMFTTVGQSGKDRLYRATMSTSWDTSTLSTNGYMQLRAATDGGIYGDPQGVWFNETYVYVSQKGFIANFLIASLPWNNSEIQSYENTSVDVSGTFANDDYKAINVDPTGTKLFCADVYNRQLVQYSLGTAHDLSTLNTGTRITVSLDTLIPNVDTSKRNQFQSISIVPRTTGTKLYLADYRENEIYSLNLN